MISNIHRILYRGFLALNLSAFCAILQAGPLVDISTACPTITLDIRYASKNNCTGEQIYAMPKCFILSEVARALQNVQVALLQYGLMLVIFDGYQPKSARDRIRNLLIDEFQSMNDDGHARGTSVDVGLMWADGRMVDMGTEFDCLTKKARTDYTEFPMHILNARKILEGAMTEYGFISCADCWWHFDFKGWESKPVLDVEFADLM